MPIRYITVAAGLDYNETIVARDKHLVLFDTAANGTALKECLEGVVEFEEIEDCVAMPMSDLLGITLHVSKIDGELDPRVFEDTYFAIDRTAKVWQALLAAGMVLEPGGGWASLLESSQLK